MGNNPTAGYCEAVQDAAASHYASLTLFFAVAPPALIGVALCVLVLPFECCRRTQDRVSPMLQYLDFSPGFETLPDGVTVRAKPPAASGGFVTFLLLFLMVSGCWALYLSGFAPIHARTYSIPTPAAVPGAYGGDGNGDGGVMHLRGRVNIPCDWAGQLPAAQCPAAFAVTGNGTADVVCTHDTTAQRCELTWDVPITAAYLPPDGAPLSYALSYAVMFPPASDYTAYCAQQSSCATDVRFELSSLIRGLDRSSAPAPTYRAMDPVHRPDPDLTVFADACVGVWQLNVTHTFSATTTALLRRNCQQSYGPRYICGSNYGSGSFNDAAYAFDPAVRFQDTTPPGGLPGHVSGGIAFTVTLDTRTQYTTAGDALDLGALIGRLSGVVSLAIALRNPMRDALSALLLMFRARVRRGQGVGRCRGYGVGLLIATVYVVYLAIVLLFLLASVSYVFASPVPQYVHADASGPEGGLAAYVAAITFGVLSFVGSLALILIGGCFLGRDRSAANGGVIPLNAAAARDDGDDDAGAGGLRSGSGSGSVDDSVGSSTDLMHAASSSGPAAVPMLRPAVSGAATDPATPLLTASVPTGAAVFPPPGSHSLTPLS